MAKKSRSSDGEGQAAAAVPRVQVRSAEEGGGLNRKARKEEARQERERLQRKAVRRLTSTAPWPANTTDLLDRLKAMGLPALSQSTSIKQHIHAHLDVYVNGNKEPVPADIGIGSTYSAPLHTHDPTVTTTSDSATIHVEAPTDQAYTLGQFFDVWGVRLTSSCLGGYCTSGNETLQAFVDGKLVPDPRAIPLKEHEEIVLAYGAPSDVPSPVPSSFHFIKGE
jgi:hypothetical protein